MVPKGRYITRILCHDSTGTVEIIAFGRRLVSIWRASRKDSSITTSVSVLRGETLRRVRTCGAGPYIDGGKESASVRILASFALN